MIQSQLSLDSKKIKKKENLKFSKKEKRFFYTKVND